jgi:hypothetical protein
MFPKRSVLIAAALVVALLPMAAAVSGPGTASLHNALTQPLALVSVPFQSSSPADPGSNIWDIGVITMVGASLLGLAAVVRKTTRT